MFNVFLNSVLISKIYTQLGNNEALKSMMVKEIKIWKGVYLHSFILLVQGYHESAYDSMLKCTTIKEGQYNVTGLLGDVCICTFDKGHWHWKHILYEKFYNLTIKRHVGCPYKGITLEVVL